MASYNYGGGYGSSNPYDNQSGNAYGAQGGNTYGNQPSNNYAAPAPQYDGGYARQSDSVEMQPLAGAGAANPYGAQPETRDPNAVLNSCRDVSRAIDDLQSRMPNLERAQANYLSGSGASSKDIEAISADVMTGYRGLTDRVRRIKGSPDAGNTRNRPQVEALDRRIRKAMNEFQQREARFRHDMQEQQKRQYLIVNPNATEAELHEVAEAGGDQQIFQQALLNADRRGQAQSTLRNVQNRHDAIVQIERTMTELAQLFADLDAMIVQQDAPIQNIEQKAEETHTHLEAGNVQVDKATKSARAARKKKWICFGIVVALIVIILIIVFAVLASQGTFRSNNNNGGSGTRQ